MGNRLNESNIKMSVMIMPGLGGLKYSEGHIWNTVNLLNAIKPKYIALLPTVANPKLPYYEKIQSDPNNRFLTDLETIYQMISMVENLESWDCLLSAPHHEKNDVTNNTTSFYFNLTDNYEKEKTIKYLKKEATYLSKENKRKIS